ncbi:cupin domain-containing protein [Saxibacter everestensis]|uniref:Cupin domain-containing protein n=1 Tax=Saxibacter everestensis TaxID=2909229 RepID=A0ABY8QQL4_9MICO|nr:cupin domain-containing protein [Brevibacteriaceae bacterium ZFBP1038]
MTGGGPPPPSIPELVRAEDRMSFLYLERAAVHRDSNAITATDERGTVHIPAASPAYAEGKQTLSLKPGDIVRLAAGTQTWWTVTEPLRKVYLTPAD